MNHLSLTVWPALLGWGTLVGLDLVSVPQMMIARPVVAGSIAGWILGDVEAGLRVGVLLELFALDVLPVGAVRYPDYGPAAVAAAAFAAGQPWEIGLGLSAALGMLVAGLGGWSLLLLRRRTTQDIQRHAAALAAGQATTIGALHYAGIARDLGRSATLTALGLALAWGLFRAPALPEECLRLAGRVAIAGGLAAVAGGVLRGAGRGRRLQWLGAGLAIGTGWVLLA